MTNSSKRIAVLFHRGEQHADVSRYIIHHMAEYWRADGHDVVYLFGPRKYEPADVVVVHVNLSVVPDAYLELAGRYPVAVNGRVRDIRKSKISNNLLRADDPWDGPVIVKSDLNYAGAPERLLTRTAAERHWRFARRVRRALNHLRGYTPPFVDSVDYQIYNNIEQVPTRWWERDDVVVERFRPEIEDGLYHTRIFQFLGDRWTCTRVAAAGPIVKTQGSVRIEDITPDPEVLAWRERYHLDYGKLDYVINEGEVVLLDVNKTTGASHYEDDERQEALRRYRAEGLYTYFRS